MYNQDSELSSDSRSGISFESSEQMKQINLSIEENLDSMENCNENEQKLEDNERNDEMFHEEISDENICYQQLPIEKPVRKEYISDNTVNLSIENLEQIRMKAASMSLPLLTALCSDTFVIRSLSKSKREGSC